MLYLVYGQSMTGQILAVDVESVGDRIELGEPRPLFPTSVGENDKTHNIDLSADGQRILVNLYLRELETQALTWDLNWTPASEQ